MLGRSALTTSRHPSSGPSPHFPIRSLLAPLALAFGSILLLATGSDATPPTPPLDLSLVQLSPAVPGRAVPFAVEVTPRTAGERVRVRIVLPSDCSLISGDTLRLAAAPPPGEPSRFEYTVRIPTGEKRYIYVRAELVTAAGKVWTRGENLVLLAGSPRVPEVTPRVVPDGRGSTALAFDGKRVPREAEPVPRAAGGHAPDGNR